MKESSFQAALIKDLKKQFPGCMVLKNDANYIQGIPDLTILYREKWAMLECKRDSNASHQPCQEHYIDILDEMSFASFIFPENRDEVMRQLKTYLERSE